MARATSEIRLFFQEFRRNFHTTGAILPSGRRLARALGRFVAEPNGQPRRILEVGPGTAAVTQRLVSVLGPHDRLDLVELNASFVECLRRRFESEPAFVGRRRPQPRAALPRGRPPARRKVSPDRLRLAAEQLRRRRRAADSRA